MCFPVLRLKLGCCLHHDLMLLVLCCVRGCCRQSLLHWWLKCSRCHQLQQHHPRVCVNPKWSLLLMHHLLMLRHHLLMLCVVVTVGLLTVAPPAPPQPQGPQPPELLQPTHTKHTTQHSRNTKSAQ